MGLLKLLFLYYLCDLWKYPCDDCYCFDVLELLQNIPANHTDNKFPNHESFKKLILFLYSTISSDTAHNTQYEYSYFSLDISIQFNNSNYHLLILRQY